MTALGRARPVRVLVADDSATSRDVVVTLLGLDARIEVVGTARDGQDAVEQAVALRPDVVTMDVAMPRLDGLEATRRIMREAPARIVVVCAVARERAVEVGFQAIQAGALEVVAKPTNGEDPRAWGRRLLETVLLMSEVPVIRRWSTSTAPAPAPLPPLPGRRLDVVGIVASTGGPPVLATLLGALPATFAAPVLVAQHIAAGFEDGLVRWLGRTCALPVTLARDGEACAPSRVVIAPAGADVEVDGEGVLRVRPSAGGPCPSGDRLLASLAAAWGARAGGVVLSGMGEDGARGLAAVRAAGGLTLAQSEATCAVFGMPRAAIERGAAEHVLDPTGLAEVLCLAARAGDAK